MNNIDIFFCFWKNCFGTRWCRSNNCCGIRFLLCKIMGKVVYIEGYKNELAVELAKCRTLNEKILHKEIFIYDEEFKIYKRDYARF